MSLVLKIHPEMTLMSLQPNSLDKQLSGLVLRDSLPHPPLKILRPKRGKLPANLHPKGKSLRRPRKNRRPKSSLSLRHKMRTRSPKPNRPLKLNHRENSWENRTKKTPLEYNNTEVCHSGEPSVVVLHPVHLLTAA